LDDGRGKHTVAEMRYRAIFERVPQTAAGLADVPDVPGCSLSGRTIAEARDASREALSVYVENMASVEIEKEVSW
jgi:predicted RNase H-like HicB family nuclease